MTDIVNWLKQNPNEVITILWVNGGFSPTVWASAYQSTGLLEYVYTPPASSQGILQLNDWPTLGSLIANNSRVISFLDSDADYTSVPWLLDEFSNVWETSYDELDVSGFECTLNRPYSTQSQSAIPASQKLYLINHFLDYDLAAGIDVPNVTYASITNSFSNLTGSLSNQFQNCTRVNNGKLPNFMLIAFFDQGNGSSLATTAFFNNVTYTQSSGFPGTFAVPGSDNYTSSVSSGCGISGGASSSSSTVSTTSAASMSETSSAALRNVVMLHEMSLGAYFYASSILAVVFALNLA